MIRKISLLLAIFSLAAAAFAQSPEERAEKIRNDKNYIYGEGTGSTPTEADKNALANLISKIAVSVNNTYTAVESQLSNGDDITAEAAVRMVINTYAQGSLTNTESIELSEAPDARVMRYISRDELKKMFDQRRDKVMYMVRSAQKAEQKGKIDDALRYYYWAFTLLKSLQYPGDVDFTDNAGENHKLMVWLPKQIDEILDNISVKVAECNGNEATLFFTYKGEPATSLDFTFYNGNSWTLLNSVKNGLASIETRPGVDINRLKLRYEYEYAGETVIDQEIESVSKIFKGTYFRKAEAMIPGGGATLEASVSKQGKKLLEAASAANATNSIAAVKDNKEYARSIQQIIKAVTDKNYESLRPIFTDEGWDMMSKLLHYGNAKMLGKQTYSFYELPTGQICARSLVMTFAFPNNKRTFTEDVTFTFNADKKIESLAFGLGAEANKDILDKGQGFWDEKSKMQIASFLENYKTAFALKRLDYIQSIFDDNAIIIVGHVTKRPQTISDNGAVNVNNDIVTYNRMDKNQYLKHLERTFKANEFVNIRFTDNDVVKMGTGGEVYSIQIHQDYYSTHYGDTGYLFLIVDINDPENPTIKVRTWQPERDPNINGQLPSSHPDFGIFGPGNF